MPKSSTAAATAPVTRYFQPASSDNALSLWKAFSTYSAIESSSRPTKTTSRWSAFAITMAPVAAHSSNP